MLVMGLLRSSYAAIVSYGSSPAHPPSAKGLHLAVIKKDYQKKQSIKDGQALDAVAWIETSLVVNE
jgi:hypothetical protein